MPPPPLPPHEIRVLVIDDHPLFRRGVLQLLASTPHFKTVGEADTGDDGIVQALELKPDLILLDLNMKKGLDGIATLQHLQGAELDTKIVILTVSDDPQDLVTAIRAGAEGYLLKDTDPEQMIGHLNEVMFGRTVVSDTLTHCLAIALRDDSMKTLRQPSALTEREDSIVQCLAQGLSNKLIARELGIMESTVKVHIRNLLKKLNFHSRLEAAVWAVTQGQR
ncbi:two-component system response regulator NarL [Ferrovum sp.]|uniref:two-component system response regulator NarL n=1 Tax=Ferrovum sp. TaxID=2609467 RepID=UPI002604FAEB|nr:two-component system response regulator NarL [Ferrovum sp.]